MSDSFVTIDCRVPSAERERACAVPGKLKCEETKIKCGNKKSLMWSNCSRTLNTLLKHTF